MLYMDLKIGNSIKIGEAILTLKEKSGQKARLAIDADKSIEISHVPPDARQEIIKGLKKPKF